MRELVETPRASSTTVGGYPLAVVARRLHDPSTCVSCGTGAFLWRAGLRIGEALALTLADLDMDAREIHVRKAKTKAGVRCVGIDAMAHEALELWLENRPSGTQWVFVSSTHGGGGGGKRLAYTTVADMLKLIGRQAGVKKRIHPHGFRHTFATEFHREGVPVGVLSHALGHKNAEITMHYAAHVLDRMEVSQAMQQRTAPGNGGARAAQPDLNAIAAQVAELSAMLAQATGAGS